MFWYFVVDHPAEHSHDGHYPLALHAGDSDAADHEADHGHVWTISGATVVTPRVSRPRPIAALKILEDTAQPSLAPFPPFSPPRV